jgi:peptide/nickel transport system permease protein
MKALRGAQRLRDYARGDRGLRIGAVIVAATLFLALFGPLLAPHDPEAATRDVLAAPSASHWFGTTRSGVDVFSATLAAFRIDVFIALVATLGSFVVGVTLGAIAGFRFSSRSAAASSWMVLRGADMVQALPVFILALALVGVTGPSVRNVVIAVAFVNCPIFLRLTRASVLINQSLPYADAARVMGYSERRVLTRHILPNSLDPVIANASIAVGYAILLTAGLSFIGAGVPQPTPEWGSIIANGSANLVTGQWWISILPGVVLGVVVFGFAMLGDGLRRYWSPEGRKTVARLELEKAVPV